ncbi:hypothetical protein IscW_ISCW011737 [Ixodes scapularis]|uniref:Uncharacterized protein n=1 Tax=Ixodes scapularis TaxID=6945 RepID=B7Q465_IXOSC|nr:hypothetical protein IscW_ISCW011737 [Ixodes scapularis]|eukprot:XP_002411482.1 hypothetical protein IscW_ISCW011737 [Ixodes scapularis]
MGSRVRTPNGCVVQIARTLLTTVAALCGCRTEHGSRWRAAGYNLLAALLQTLTAPFVVGWVWSIMWGITFVNVSASVD